MKPRKLGQISGQSPIRKAQEEFKAEETRGRAWAGKAQAGQGGWFFLYGCRAISCMHPFWPLVWCFHACCLSKAPRRPPKRLECGWRPWHATTKEILTVQNLTYVTARGTVCEFAAGLPGGDASCIADHDRARQCRAIKKWRPWVAGAGLGAWALSCYICLAYFATISISIERLVGNGSKKQCLLRGSYYPTSADFQAGYPAMPCASAQRPPG